MPRWRMLLLTGLLLAGMPVLAACDRPALDSLPAPTDPQYTDAWITRQVLLRLDLDPELTKFQIHVQTNDSIVYLQGTLPSEQLRQRAARLTAGAPYVTSVRNNITIQPGPGE